MAKHAAPKRRRDIEDDEYAKFLGRAIAGMERRASQNPDALAYFLTLQEEMKGAVDRAGYRLHKEAGVSLRDIARLIGYSGHKMSPQNVIKRWGPAAMERKMGIPSITNRINERRDKFRAAAGDELAARRAARKAV